MTRLHLGCGKNYIDGWVNIDLVGHVDLIHDIAKPLPYGDGSVDLVFMEHVIEHFPREVGIIILKDILRVLVKGGAVRISTPSLRRTAERYLLWAQRFPNSSDSFRNEWSDVGWFPETPCRYINESMRLWGHRFIYDWNELKESLHQSGFANIRKSYYRRSEIPDLEGLECRPYHQELIVEAIK